MLVSDAPSPVQVPGSLSRNTPRIARTHIRDALLYARIVGDGLTALAALAFAHFLRFSAFKPYLPFAELHSDFYTYEAHFLIGSALFLVISANLGLYRGRNIAYPPSGLVLKSATMWFFVFLGFSLIFDIRPPISRIFAAFAGGSMVLCQLAWQSLFDRLLILLNANNRFRQRILIVGGGRSATETANRLRVNVASPYEFVGFVIGAEESESEIPHDRMLGHSKDLEAVCERHRPDQVLVVDNALTQSEVLAIARVCERRFIGFSIAATAFEVFTSCLRLGQLAGVPVMGVAELPANRVFSRISKRIVDIAGATVGLALSAPIVAVLAVLIKRESSGPVLYRQTRVGQDGRHFQILKLRSMRLDAEMTGGARWATERDPRRTRIGEYMRRTNLDELPQFWNVFKGEMSLVGPRPERPELIPQFLNQIPYYQSRHSVKPGMTGWAQVNGLRGNTSLMERIRYDLQYIENWSLWWDFSIQLQTFFKVRNAY